MKANPLRLSMFVLIAIAAAATAAFAAFPGKNGRVAYRAQGGGAIFLTETGQVTFPTLGVSFDYDPAFSPDGTKIAFIRRYVYTNSYRVMQVNSDGSNLTFLSTSTTVPGLEGYGRVLRPAWTADGQRVSFVVDSLGGELAHLNGVWTLAGGPGATQVVAGVAESASWSSLGAELLYVCSFRNKPDGTPRLDLCIWDAYTESRDEIPIDIDMPNIVSGNALDAKWTSDSEEIIFQYEYVTRAPGANYDVVHSDIFAVDLTGGNLRKLTDSGPPVCTSFSEENRRTSATYTYESVTPSPDGSSFVVKRWTNVHPPGSPCSSTNAVPTDKALYTFPTSGGTGTLLLADPGSLSFGTDWEPIPAGLIVRTDDGYGHPLDDLRVELRDPTSHAVVHEDPQNNGDGVYVFEDVGPGDYDVRLTLIDYSGGPGSTPAFEIRHGQEPDWAVWIEHRVTVPPGGGEVAYRPFAQAETITRTEVLEASQDRLDDMATIYYHLKRYVDWVKRTLTSTTGATVELYAFADVDPMEPYDVPPEQAYYVGTEPRIVFGTDFSRREFRDGVSDGNSHGDLAPENGEWHEFTHHLWHTFVSDPDGAQAHPPCQGVCTLGGNTCTTSADCTAGDDDLCRRNHGGYANPDTCDSMSEGFAAFLPAAAALEIDGAKDSYYDGLLDLEPPLRAWNSRTRSSGERVNAEDLAVAALFWDLHDAQADHVDDMVIGQDGMHRTVTYTDAENASLPWIWNLVRTARPRTVNELHDAYGPPAPSIDLDGDNVDDIAPVDQVFLMHGFFPIDEDQTLTGSHKTYHYDVNYSQRHVASDPRNAAVGLTNHRAFSADGTVTQEFLSRSHTPTEPNAFLALDVRDASGTPLSGAEVELVLEFPGQQETRSVRRLGSGNGNLVYLELPPYFNYLLPDDAPLPSCDPQNDLNVSVTIHTTVNGYLSADAPAVDSCTYMQAVAAASAPGAVALTVTFPEDSTPPVSTFRSTPTEPLMNGATTGAWVVRLSCDDPADSGFAAGCSRIEYRIDGGPLKEYTRQFRIAEVGVHELEFHSVDAAGNEESFQLATLEVAPPPDADSDGLSDALEAFYGTDPTDPDTDDDGLIDGDEVNRGTNPLLADSDGDGLDDGTEVNLGTSPLLADTDGDGLTDDVEVASGLDPVNPDTDADGHLDGADNCAILANPQQADSDLDGLGDFCDDCPADADPGQADGDGDGAGDACDCWPANPTLRSPGEPRVVVDPNGFPGFRLAWQPVAGADDYSVMRGTRGELQSGNFGACLGNTGGATYLEDAELPASGEVFVYLVQGQSYTCGFGTLGFGAGEALRVNTHPAACQAAVVEERTTLSDAFVYGSIYLGAHTDTHQADGESLVIQEELSSGGSPSSRYSRLDYRLTVDVAPGAYIQLVVQGFQLALGDGDVFVFEWSSDGTTFTPVAMDPLPLADDGSLRVAPLPAALGGSTVTLRVVDTDRTSGNQALDLLWIDWLAVRSITP